MDIANINALTRPVSYPTRTAAASGTQRAVTAATRDATAAVRAPVEQVLQGELLQKRRKASAYDASIDLLDTLRAMDRVLRDSTPATTSTPPRNARRAIATYTQQAMGPTGFAGVPASTIDYFV